MTHTCTRRYIGERRERREREKREREERERREREKREREEREDVALTYGNHEKIAILTEIYVFNVDDGYMHVGI